MPFSYTDNVSDALLQFVSLPHLKSRTGREGATRQSRPSWKPTSMYVLAGARYPVVISIRSVVTVSRAGRWLRAVFGVPVFVERDNCLVW